MVVFDILEYSRKIQDSHKLGGGEIKLGDIPTFVGFPHMRAYQVPLPPKKTFFLDSRMLGSGELHFFIFMSL